AQNAGVPAMLLSQRSVHHPPRFLAQRRQLARQAVALRLVLYDKPAVPGPAAVVGEAEEGEGLRTPFAAPLSGRGRKATELDQARFVLMEPQAEPSQAF